MNNPAIQTQTMSEPKHDLYEKDFYTWTIQQAEYLRGGQISQIDLYHLADEIEDMGKNVANALKSQFERLIAHLLKWQFQPNLRQPNNNSWQATISNARYRIQELLEDYPGLASKCEEKFHKAYRGAVCWAVIETGLPLSHFPQTCPYTLEQVLDETFLPE